MPTKDDANVYIKNLATKWDAEMKRRLDALAKQETKQQSPVADKEQKQELDFSPIIDKLSVLNDLMQDLLITVKLQANTNDKILSLITDLNNKISDKNMDEIIVEDI